ncbi:carbohydrate ABC transporter membrane protein 1 (CUT1 family) [Murinocardiopsis flavida]|uniref:Carbohydrate ABC transporter membrane protein 1 (CUT1 family) n=1 Tax=Murinocardiopsis flavida TaxID=645275 RepID=A0A2P8DFG0_9ACTN|nr:sugar ABC transporter permease [Murinocardiopsis flavida]PSK95955.1 carbohydrate ABC transporter membrane protein 1 (CUT1 family) [Murinocardiopsis flavida]
MDAKKGIAALTRPTGYAERRARFALVLVSPTFLVIALVVVVPFFWTLFLAVTEIRLIDLPYANLFNATYTLGNFADVLSSSTFWESVGATIAYTFLGTVGSIALGLAAALALRRAFFGRALLRSLVLVPFAVPVVAAALLWQTMLDPQFGLVNAIGLRWLGWSEPIMFLSQRTAHPELLGVAVPVPVALLTVVAFEVWRSFAFAFLFLLARLQSIGGDLVEAARIDGAAPTQVFRHIVWPQLWGVISLLLMLRAIFVFQNFTDVYLLTGGAGGTQVMAVQVYEYLTARNDLGGASALGLVMSATMGVLLVAYVWRSQPRKGVRA